MTNEYELTEEEQKRIFYRATELESQEINTDHYDPNTTLLDRYEEVTMPLREVDTDDAYISMALEELERSRAGQGLEERVEDGLTKEEERRVNISSFTYLIVPQVTTSVVGALGGSLMAPENLPLGALVWGGASALPGYFIGQVSGGLRRRYLTEKMLRVKTGLEEVEPGRLERAIEYIDDRTLRRGWKGKIERYNVEYSELKDRMGQYGLEEKPHTKRGWSLYSGRNFTISHNPLAKKVVIETKTPKEANDIAKVIGGTLEPGQVLDWNEDRDYNIKYGRGGTD